MRTQDGKLAKAVPGNSDRDGRQLLPPVALDPQCLVASEDPVALVNSNGDIKAANAAGRKLLWSALSGSEEISRLLGLVEESHATGTVTSCRVTLSIPIDDNDADEFQDVKVEITQVDPSSRTFDIFILPADAGARDAILIAREVTFEQNLSRALTSSRSLFKDLVSCSADFSWEIDQSGSFTYIGPRGALGYSSSELNGCSLSTLVVDENALNSAIELFQSPHEVREVPICLLSKDGEVRHYSMASKPFFNEHGHHTGNRGVGRDVTELVLQRIELDEARRRKDAIHAVLEATTSTLDPSAMLEKATRALTSSLDAVHGLLFLAEPSSQASGAELTAETIAIQEGEQWRDLQTEDYRPSEMISSLLPFAARSLLKGQERSELMVDNWRHLIVPTSFQDKLNGVICVSKPMASASWSKEQRELFSDLAQTIGIAVGQANQTLQLTKLSRQDPLTQLLNRRSFEEEVSRRLQQHRRHNRPSALLYIDVDNFKTINDTYGHQAGDRVLCNLARILQENLRTSDIAVRFGGDEFGVWLEETDQEGAEIKAQQILSLIAQLQKQQGLAVPVEASIGVAPVLSGGVSSVEDLTTIADAALYQAKAAGKGTYRVTEPEEKSTLSPEAI